MRADEPIEDVNLADQAASQKLIEHMSSLLPKPVQREALT
jgi:hypothetical protein